MKQEITEEQFDELTELQKSEWYAFCRKNKYVQHDKGGNEFMIKGVPSIGEMIAFLDEHDIKWLEEIARVDSFDVGGDDETNDIVENYSGELCDALWSDVKNVLTNETT